MTEESEMSEPFIVAPTGDRCGEAPVWSASEGAVYSTDVNRFLIHRCDLRDRSVRSWIFDEPVVALALTTRPGALLVALGSRLIWWWPADDRREDHGFTLPGWPRVRLNDGRADPAGNFWVGSMKNNVEPDGEAGSTGPGEGVLFRVGPDGAVSEELHGIGVSNTVCWSPDGTRFYFGDSLANRISAFDYDAATGRIGAGRPFFAGFERGSPDGSAVDAAGYLWNCRYKGSCIVRVAPDGRIDRIVEMPSLAITCCTFGGPDLRTLLITTASADRRPGDRLAGGLFGLAVDVPGLPERPYRWAGAE
jgi:sugar lactone lactonase YvrE